MNVDHFIPADGKKARKSLLKNLEQYGRIREEGEISEEEDETELNRILDHAMAAKEVFLMGAKPSNKEAYMETVRDTYYRKVWNKLQRVESEDSEKSENKNKKKKNKKKKKKPITREELIERYSIVNIGGSVIPTFNPAFRIWEYNISDIANESDFSISNNKPWDEFFESLDKIMEESLLEDEMNSDNFDSRISSERSDKEKKRKSDDKTVPVEMPDEYELGPAYIPQLFTPTRFVQFYADLEKINKKYYSSLSESKDVFKYEVEYTSDEMPYSMDSLTVGSYLDLAGRLYEDNPAWEQYVEWSFASSGYKDD